MSLFRKANNPPERKRSSPATDAELAPPPVDQPTDLGQAASKNVYRGDDKNPNDVNKDVNKGPVENPLVKGGNTGWERFLELHRLSRGNTHRSYKRGRRYTEGKYKGMTPGQADVNAWQQFKSLNEEQRDQYREKNAKDLEAERQRRLQAERDKLDLAEEAKKRGISPADLNKSPAAPFQTDLNESPDTAPEDGEMRETTPDGRTPTRPTVNPEDGEMVETTPDGRTPTRSTVNPEDGDISMNEDGRAKGTSNPPTTNPIGNNMAKSTPGAGRGTPLKGYAATQNRSREGFNMAKSTPGAGRGTPLKGHAAKQNQTKITPPKKEKEEGMA